MTNKEKNNNPEIVEDAKRLKIKSWHLKDIERVKAEIEDAKKEPIVVPVADPAEAVAEVGKPPPLRKLAPKMPIAGIGMDSRAKRIAELEAADPWNKYLFQEGGISDEDLLKKGFERTGETLKNDIVVRTERKRYEEIQELNSTHQRRMMDSIDADGEKIISETEQPKKGKT